MTKSFRVVQFDTTHYSSLKPETKELELVLKKNALPKMDRMLHNVLRSFGRREKEQFEKHSISDLMEIFAGKEGSFPEEVKKMMMYLEELDVDEIVTPVRKVTDFITNDLIATSPSYLGGMLQQYHRVQGELRVITNRPEKPTNSYMKFLVIAMMVGMGGVGVFIAYDSGAFDGVVAFSDNLGTIGDGFSGLPSPTAGIQRSNTGGVDYSDAALMNKYPDCNAMTADINAGTIDYNKLSSTMQGFIDSCP